MLPNLIENIMYGYIFLFIYRWVAFKNKDDTKYTLIVSIILNYILVLLYNKISLIEKFSFIQDNRTFWYIIFSFIFGFIIGRICISESYNEILRDLHIGRDTIDNIWDNAVKNGTWMRIYTKDPNISYLGYVVKSEPYASNPKIILSGYKILDDDGNVLSDYSEDENEYVIMSTDDFDRIEITYSNNSECLYHKIKRGIKEFFKK